MTGRAANIIRFLHSAYGRGADLALATHVFIERRIRCQQRPLKGAYGLGHIVKGE